MITQERRSKAHISPGGHNDTQARKPWQTCDFPVGSVPLKQRTSRLIFAPLSPRNSPIKYELTTGILRNTSCLNKGTVDKRSAAKTPAPAPQVASVTGYLASFL